MNCCDENGDCRQGRDCPVRRQRAYPATLPPNLPVWPEPEPLPDWKRRVLNIAAALGYAGLLVVLVSSALLAIHAWTAWWVA